MIKMDAEKTKPRAILFFTVIIVAIGNNFLIYNSSVVNNLQPAVVKYLNETGYGSWISNQPEIRWSVVASAFSAGSAIGSLWAPFFAEYLGRKKSLMFSGFLNVIGGIMCALYLKLFELSLVGRILQGVSLGMGLPLASAFVTEITPVKYRGKFNALLQTAFGTGDLCGMLLSMEPLLGSIRLSNYCMAFTLIPSLLEIIVLIFSYDTPRHLILKRRRLTIGKKALEYYQGKVAAIEAMKEILSEKSITLATNINISDEKHKNKYLTFWSSRSARINIMLSSLLLITLGFTGVSPIMTWSTDAFIKNGISPDTSQLCTVTLGLCNFAGSFIAISLTERWGRKRLFAVGLFGCFGSVLSFTIFSAVITYTYVTKCLAYALVICLDFFLLFFSMVCAAGNTQAAEICSQSYRSIALSLANFWLMAISTLLINIYSYVDSGLGNPWVFLPSSCLSVLTGCYLIYSVPETAGKSLSDIKHNANKVVK